MHKIYRDKLKKGMKQNLFCTFKAKMFRYAYETNMKHCLTNHNHLTVPLYFSTK